MKNRIASLFLVFAMLMSLTSGALARDNRITIRSGGAENFTDVPTDHWAYAYINKVVGSGLFNGMTATTFAPSDAMTRAQFVVVMARMEGLGDLERQETQTIFPDVAPTYWAAGPIAWATQEGIVGGFGDGTFKPASPITRGQFAALIHRYIVSKNYVNLQVVDPEPAQFTDAASVSTAFTNDVEYARVHGLLTGYSDGTVRAGNPITRAAIAAILARFLDLVQESGYTPLLDGDTGNSGDTNNGDTGNSGTTSSSYDDITLNVTGGTHGTTSISSVTRNGVAVASDDLQPGDRVTITHTPADGYTASVRVRDAHGKTVTKHTTGNTTWFYAPTALPVTVTVTYERITSGGGGSSSSSTGGTTAPDLINYYLTVTATSVGNGTVALRENPPTETDFGWESDANSTTRTLPLSHLAVNSALPGDPNFTYYVVLTPATGASISELTVTAGTISDTFALADLTLIDGTFSYYIERTFTAATPNTANNVAVSGTFTGGDQTENGWTITNNVVGGSAQLFADANRTTTLNFNTALSNTEVWVQISPDTEDFTLTTALTATNADVEEVTGIEGLAEQVHVYHVTRATTTGALTSVLSAQYTVDESKAALYVGTITFELTALDENGDEIANPDDLPVAPSLEKDKLEVGATAKVFVPYTNGYGSGYQVESVTATATNGSTPVVTEDSSIVPAAQTDTNGYTFTMPNADVVVHVVYRRNADEQLDYTVNTTITGKGSVTVNVGGDAEQSQNVTLSSASNTTEYHITQSQYVAAYGEPTDTTNWPIPVSVRGTPVASSTENYEYNNGLTFNSATWNGSERMVNRNATANVGVTFTQIPTIGYNLTIIGPLVVTVASSNTALALPAEPNTNADGMPYTVNAEAKASSASITVSASLPTSEAGAWDASTIKLYRPDDVGATPVNLSNSSSAQITLDDGIKNLIISVEPQGAVDVNFTVNVSGYTNNVDAVLIKAENGTLTSGTSTLQPGTTMALQNGNGQQFTAKSGTIITLLPQTTDTLKVKNITTVGTESTRDAMASTGYSFKLANTTAAQSATVTFGTLNAASAYSVKAQLPFAANFTDNAFMHGLYQGIPASTSLQSVLYYLNNGSDSETIFGQTPLYLNDAITRYLKAANSDVEADLNGDGRLNNVDDLQDTLNSDSLKQTVANNLQQVMNAQKNAMVTTQTTPGANGQPAPVFQSLRTALSSYNTSELSGSKPLPDTLKNSILNKLITEDSELAASYRAGSLDITGTVSITPLLTTANETSKPAATATASATPWSAAVQAETAGNSLESQLTSAMTNYLNDLSVTPGSVDPVANVILRQVETTNNRTASTLVVSANVDFRDEYGNKDNNKLPVLSLTPFSNYTNGMTLYVVAEVTVTVLVNGTAQSEPRVVTSVYPLSNFNGTGGINADSIMTSINSRFASVDTDLRTMWSDKLNELLRGTSSKPSNTMAFGLGDILTKKLLDDVVENAFLDTAVKKITNRINKLGDENSATATKDAIRNLYYGLVNFNEVQPDDSGARRNLITLNQRGGGTVELAYANEQGNLVVNLDFEDLASANRLGILRDAAGSNQTVYEQIVDLMVAFRDGLATDLAANGGEGNQTAQSVLATMILSQLRNRGELNAVKWGNPIDFRNTTEDVSMEKKELANLLAEMMMRPLDTTNMNTAWSNLEASGYSQVALSLGINGERHPKIQPFTSVLNQLFGTSDDTLRGGFIMSQNVN